MKASEASSESASPDHNHTWSSLPKHDDSRFDADDDLHAEGESEDDDLFSASPRRTAVQDPSSIYAGLTNVNLPIARSRPSTGNAESAREGEESEDLLSLPSSLSISSGQSSRRNHSPRRRLLEAQGHSHLPRIQSASSLTAAALRQNEAENKRSATPLDHREVILTSGSEDEGESEGGEAIKAYERALLATPDAISVGIKPLRRKNRSALQETHPMPQASVGSQSATSAKRRHRQAGSSSKGSKRSNTSQAAASYVGRLPDETPRQRKSRREGRERQREQRVEESHATQRRVSFSAKSPSTLKGFSRFARIVFSHDEDILDLMSQPSSIFGFVYVFEEMIGTTLKLRFADKRGLRNT